MVNNYTDENIAFFLLEDLENIGDMMAHYLLELYKTDKQITKALKKVFESNPITCFEKLTDKSVIATLNTTQADLLMTAIVFMNLSEMEFCIRWRLITL